MSDWHTMTLRYFSTRLATTVVGLITGRFQLSLMVGMRLNTAKAYAAPTGWRTVIHKVLMRELLVYSRRSLNQASGEKGQGSLMEKVVITGEYKTRVMG